VRINKKILFTLKLAIAIAAFGFVFAKLYVQGVTGITNSINFELFSYGWPLLVLALLLMPIGWGFEAAKWITALKDIEKTSFLNALKTIWYGVGVGLLTPNRIGEPIGRIAMVDPENRVSAGIMAVLCGMSQQLATIVFGSIGLAFLFGTINQDVTYIFSSSIVVLLISASIIIPVFLVFKLNWLVRQFHRIKYFNRFLSGEPVNFHVPRSKVFVLFALSLIRYVIFSTQFILLLHFFGYNLSLLKAYSSIFATYLLASAVPSFAVGEAGVRTSFAIIFIGALWPNPSGIAFAALSLWFLNVALPGLIGVWFPFKLKREGV
jgi:hypothetical protein